MKYRFLKIVTSAILIVAAVSGLISTTQADDTSSIKNIESHVVEAENLTGQCTYSSNYDRQYFGAIMDNDLDSVIELHESQEVSVSWNDDIPVSRVFFEFAKAPESYSYSVKEYDTNGKLLNEMDGKERINFAVDTQKNTRTVTLSANGTIELAAFRTYSVGEIQNCHDWKDTPEKLDYLIVATHPDDDVLFLGAISTIYGGQNGLIGTVAYMAANNRIRQTEALNGVWTMGCKYYPIISPFRDCASENHNIFNEHKIILYLTKLIRQYKPEVVFTQDLNGEYGHWQHRTVSKCVVEAVRNAADEDYEPDYMEPYAPWSVKKLYLHLYEENKISIDVESPLYAFNGESATDVVKRAFKCHASQQSGRHYVNKSAVYSLSDFGLFYTTVGADTQGLNDPFEHTSSPTIMAYKIKNLPSRLLAITTKEFPSAPIAAVITRLR